MLAGNFVAVVAMGLVVWAAFTILGGSPVRDEARLVVLGKAETPVETALEINLPDNVRVGSIQPDPGGSAPGSGHLATARAAKLSSRS